MSDPSKPLINIPVPGPVLLLDLFPHTLFYIVIVLVDYYLYCRTSIPYQKYKTWYTLFHILLPFLIGPSNHGFTTPFIAAPWFVASVGAFCSQKYKDRQIKDETIKSPQSFLSWLKSIGIEGFTQKSDQQPNGTTLTYNQVRMEGLIRFIGVIFVMTMGSIFLTPFLLEDYNDFFTFPWYSTQCIYYGFLMGLKSYTLMISNDILSSIIQIVTGYRVLPVFNKPFLATR
ncbi:hypothetical protein BDF21DRAFT_422039 [Thamnidium elegans]|nr:hypothetical protein BDF21DRAFT_422039 [Thamnidium elegans]